jgi:hypothetical protein
MSVAKKTQSLAHNVCDDSVKAHRQCLSENTAQYHSLHQSFQRKAATSKNLCEVLQRRIKSVTISIDKNRHSLAALEQAHRAKDAPLQLCLWRIDHRGKRPQRENIRDPFEIALEEEHSALMNAQADLKVQMERTQKSIADLTDSQKELQHDYDVKSHALQIDEQCMRSTHKPWHKNTGVPRAGALPPTSSKAFIGNNFNNEDMRQSESMKRDDEAKMKESSAQVLRDDNSNVIEQCQQACDFARSKTEKFMQDRISENQAMRKRLEAEVKDTNTKIDKVKATMAETKSHIKSLIEPRQLNDTRDGWRKQRAYREQILDPVSTQMVEHKMHLIKTNDQLVDRRNQEKVILADLEKRKAQLLEDLADKTKALQIDLDCLSHTVVSQGGRSIKSLATPRFQRALKIESNFTPISMRATH